MNNKVKEILEAVEIYKGLELHFRMKHQDEFEKLLTSPDSIPLDEKTIGLQNAFDRGRQSMQSDVNTALFKFKQETYK